MSRFADFDAFWAELDAPPLAVCAFGRERELPPTQPAVLVLLMARMTEMRDDPEFDAVGDLRTVIDCLFGRGEFDRAIDAGASIVDLTHALRKVHELYQADMPRSGEGRQARGLPIKALLERMPFIEADFLREYRLHLRGELEDGMTWRRFTVLLSGLSPDSWWHLYERNRPREGAEIDAYFASLGKIKPKGNGDDQA
jgi:hypothetical protein